nr:hypothetical protein BaRGS_012618 [Batillaria attramentaria]
MYGKKTGEKGGKQQPSTSCSSLRRFSNYRFSRSAIPDFEEEPEAAGARARETSEQESASRTRQAEILDEILGEVEPKSTTENSAEKSRSILSIPDQLPFVGVEERMKKCRKISVVNVRPWKLRYWQCVLIPITRVDRNIDYKPSHNLGDYRLLSANFLQPDPRTDPDRPQFIPGGSSNLAKAQEKKSKARLRMSSIKLTKDIPLVPTPSSRKVNYRS